MSDTIAIEVAYALPTKQRIVKLDVPAGTTALEAVKQSQLDTVFEDLEISDDIKLGVWGKSVTADRALASGERVEIYRPLLADPKEVRKSRAARAKAARAGGDQASESASSD
jgi:putative ubiquitin-RnfH superfamily antitoxin RatB of RatAB toxin-antitoxin module